jgi:hypothetical protein
VPLPVRPPSRASQLCLCILSLLYIFRLQPVLDTAGPVVSTLCCGDCTVDLGTFTAMSFIPRPPPIYDAATLSSLVDQPVADLQHILTHTRPVIYRRQTAPARPSGWNRQSILLFADFNKFEGPRCSRSQWRAEQEDDSDYGSPPDSPSDESHFSSDSIDEKTQPEPPYHVFSLAKKKQMVYIVSLAGLFSPLSSNIYFPALGQISKVSASLKLFRLNLTSQRIST